VKRARQRSGGLREALIANQERSLERWAIPGKPDAFLAALRAGEAVVVSSAMVMGALIHARRPCDEYCFGGRYFRSTFLLDEHDELREVDAHE
jgi:hypothetical protein